MAIPTKLPEWDTTQVNSVEVDQQHKDEGWLAPAGVPEKPPFQSFNWWQNLVYQWVLRFKNITGGLNTVTELLSFTEKVDKTSVNVRGYVNLNDGGGGTFNYDSTFDKSLADGGLFIDPDQTIANQGNGVGTGCWIRQLDDNRVLCNAYGIIPDDGIDHHGNGLMAKVLQACSNNGFNLVFPTGVYNTAMNNEYSNVTMTFERGAFFRFTVHAAVNTGVDPLLNRPKNVTIWGECGSYERVGTFNCDDVYIERIVVKSDPTSGTPTSFGVHFYLGTNNLTVGEIEVFDVGDNAEYGVGIDFVAANPATNVSIGKIHVHDSNVHGVYIQGENINISEITVDGYGAGSQDTALPNATLPESQALKGVWFNIADEGTNVDKIVVNQIAGVRANAHDGVYCDSGIYTIGNVKVDGASNRGFAVDAQVEDPKVSVNSIDVLNSVDYGLHIVKGSLHCNHLKVDTSGNDNIFVAIGKVLTGGTIISLNGSNRCFVQDVDSAVRVLNILLSQDNTDKNIMLISGGRLSCDRLEVSASAQGLSGGIWIANTKEVNIQSLLVKNVGTAIKHGLEISESNNIRIGKAIMSNGDGQGLRLVNLTDCSIEGLDVGFYDSNVIGAGLTRVGFMNCYNHDAVTTLTNLSIASATYFNADTMYA